MVAKKLVALDPACRRVLTPTFLKNHFSNAYLIDPEILWCDLVYDIYFIEVRFDTSEDEVQFALTYSPPIEPYYMSLHKWENNLWWPVSPEELGHGIK